MGRRRKTRVKQGIGDVHNSAIWPRCGETELGWGNRSVPQVWVPFAPRVWTPGSSPHEGSPCSPRSPAAPAGLWDGQALLCLTGHRTRPSAAAGPDQSQMPPRGPGSSGSSGGHGWWARAGFLSGARPPPSQSKRGSCCTSAVRRNGSCPGVNVKVCFSAAPVTRWHHLTPTYAARRGRTSPSPPRPHTNLQLAVCHAHPRRVSLMAKTLLNRSKRRPTRPHTRDPSVVNGCCCWDAAGVETIIPCRVPEWSSLMRAVFTQSQV